MNIKLNKDRVRIGPQVVSSSSVFRVCFWWLLPCGGCLSKLQRSTPPPLKKTIQHFGRMKWQHKLALHTASCRTKCILTCFCSTSVVVPRESIPLWRLPQCCQPWKGKSCILEGKSLWFAGVSDGFCLYRNIYKLRVVSIPSSWKHARKCSICGYSGVTKSTEHMWR